MKIPVKLKLKLWTKYISYSFFRGLFTGSRRIEKPQNSARFLTILQKYLVSLDLAESKSRRILRKQKNTSSRRIEILRKPPQIFFADFYECFLFFSLSFSEAESSFGPNLNINSTEVSRFSKYPDCWLTDYYYYYFLILHAWNCFSAEKFLLDIVRKENFMVL